jgi:tetratricopeptide (TPR) repeat protein
MNDMNVNPNAENEDDRDEKRIASMLSSMNKDAPPPDEAFLQRLREQSTNAFLAGTTPQTQTPQVRRRLMFRGTLRWAASAAAVLVLLAGGYFLFFADKGPDLDSVLQGVAKADSLHIKVTSGARSSELWAVRGGKLRWDEGDTYQVAREGRLWQIDEKAKKKTPRTKPYFLDGGKAGFDVLALLDLDDEDRAFLAKQRPVRTVMHDGHSCHFFHCTLPGNKVQIAAYVDVATQHLLSLEATSVGGPTKIDPLAQITILAWNEKVDEDKFVVKDGLSEDSRLGKLVDVQGVVSVKPVMHDRWTPVRAQLPLKPGDWIQTDPRGANAVALRFEKAGRLIVGPGSLVELVTPTQVRVHQGILEVTGAPKNGIEVVGPFKNTMTVEGTQLVKVEKEKLVRVPKEPLWLKGFKGTTTHDSVGSLIANVEGRNVALTVGYHKVTVDIRDQIARTTIEESFVNHTNERLEGIFNFPLPQDASISGFGMWIGNELVEADVVEKQRAREIYETIRSENRDPGLLEWNGGNIFTARVWPIFAHSEKRIKITYTQVLPLCGDKFTYSYALQSEMLKQHPLRELAIDVKINSAVPIKSVECPSHLTRNDKTKHSAHVEFAAKEYTPERDFEVVTEIDGAALPIVLVPHRRGDDGYFLMQVMPPAGGAVPERSILANGKALNLILLCDTSASMDSRQRSEQAAFLAALLTSLTTKDTFNLGACDVDTSWAFSAPKPATPENVRMAREFLSNRSSLGWTDLDRAFASAFKQTNADTNVIYIGDGVSTARDTDPAAFVKRLRKMYEKDAKGPVHAVAVGSTHDMTTLKAMGSLGGGSVRRIGGEETPSVVARELLDEVTQPSLRDVKVEFSGVRTARVYPEQLPNVPAGSQQVVLGRYLPEGTDKPAEVIVTGTLDGKPVRYAAPIVLKDAEKGNSFIPRLWARMHLDVLLEQGSSDTVKDEIIALSEEYNIITPHTSLLVLETDADRERFKVKRRFQMRDGEKFFAQGRDNVNYDLTQKQMKKAATYRIGLRQAALRKLATLGRNPSLFQRPERRGYPRQRLLRDGGGNGTYWGFTGGMGGLKGAEKLAALQDEINPDAMSDPQVVNDSVDRLAEDAAPASLAANEPLSLEKAAADHPGPADDRSPETYAETREFERLERDKDLDAKLDDVKDMKKLVDGEFEYGRRKSNGYRRELAEGQAKSELAAADAFNYPRITWFEQLVSRVPAVAGKVKEPADRWPAEARDLARSLLRDKKLAALKGGIALTQRTENFNVRRGGLSSRHDRFELIATKAWFLRDDSDRGPVIVRWADAKERGLYNRPLGLGRVRVSAPTDLVAPLDLGDYSIHALDRFYDDYKVEVQKGDKEATLTLTHPRDPKSVTRVKIDTEKHVVLSFERLDGDKVVSMTKFSDFVEAAGCWWAQSMETTNAEGKKSETVTLGVKELDADEFDQAWQENESLDKIQFLPQPLPTVSEAKRALLRNRAGVDGHITLMLHFAQSQQWARAEEHFAAAEKESRKPGLRWIGMALVAATRRNDELRQRLNAEAVRLAKLSAEEQAGSDVLYLANHLISQAPSVLEAREVVALLDRLTPIAEHQPKHRHVPRQWAELRINYLPSDQSLALLKKLATDFPYDMSLQQQYAQRLAQAGEYPAAYSWITGILKAEGVKWTNSEEESLRTLYTSLLEQQGRFSEIVDYTTEWTKKNPEGMTPYAQLLSALVKTDQEKKADELIETWLKEGHQPGKLSSAAESRLQAAIRQAIGQGHNLYTWRTEAKWMKPLAEVVLACARKPQMNHLANTIMYANGFSVSDEGRRVRKILGDELLKNLQHMPVSQIDNYIEWLVRNDDSQSKEGWNAIATGLQKRWAETKDEDHRETLGRLLVRVLSNRGMTDELLAFFRLQLKEGGDKHKMAHARQLFDHVISQTDAEKFEDEIFALIDQISEPANVNDRLATLYRVTDRLVEARVHSANTALEHPEKLTRTELAKKKDGFLAAARIAVADRIRQESGKHGKFLSPWYVMEANYLDVRGERELKRAAGDCWTIAGDKPKAAPAATVDPDEENEQSVDTARIDAILRNRCLLTLGYLAARKGADPELAGKLFAYFDAGMSGDSEEAGLWKTYTYEMLLALDRAKDLEATLGKWVKADATETRWRLALGYLLAEQGRIPEAITLFEKVEASDDLASAAYKALADWYMVVDRRDAHERAKVAMYKTMPEHQLSQMTQMKLNRHQRTDQAPPALEKDTLLMFEALFAKATYPQNYLWQVQQFYQATHDFRLLIGLADAVVGQTAGRVYPFLEGMRGVLEEVRDEATADEIFAQIDKARKVAKTDVDRRALDLLEMLLRWRAARLKNQPGPHADAALAAFRRAVKPAWTEGEPRLMADLLHSMGNVDIPALRDEQLKLLEKLYKGEKPGTPVRLHIANRYGQTLNMYSRREASADLLAAALKEFQQAHNNVLPPSANNAIETYIGTLEEMGAHVRAEKFLLEHRKVPFPQHQALWLQMRIYRLYQHALDHHGEVSLGKEDALYHAFEKAVIADLGTTDQNHRMGLINVLSQLYQQAHKQNRPGVDDDLRAFAFTKLLELLKANPVHYDQIVSNMSYTVRNVLGPVDGVTFVLNVIEKEPRWLRLNNNDGWARHAWSLAQWRHEAGKKLPGEIQDRLLRIVLAELRLDLESMQQRSRTIYYQHTTYYWPEKEADFVKVAEEVLAKRLNSGPAVQYIADYFYWGVQRHARAIEVLQAAHAQKLLDEGGRFKLVDFLHRQTRYGESVALLIDLIKDNPGNLGYRTHLMTSYYQTKKPAELAATLKEADDYFHKENRWQHHVMAALGHACYECGLYEKCVAYYKELIPLHQRTHARRGSGDGQLANFYLELAKAFAALKKTPEAVEAACAGIVSWGPHFQQRVNALHTLYEVLRDSPNLDAFITEIDQKGAETGMDSAIIRKAIGEVLFDKGQFEKATIQLRRASELQPNNSDVNKKLVECFDKRNDKDGAAAQLLASVQLSRRDLNLYQELGKRYADQGKSDEAERAFTSIVEMMPTDASSHMMLASVREGQNRWDDALHHWSEAVRLRTMEPNPLIGLAKAQIHQRQVEKASQTLMKLKAQQWPARFNEAPKQIGEVEKLLEEAKK